MRGRARAVTPKPSDTQLHSQDFMVISLAGALVARLLGLRGSV